MNCPSSVAAECCSGQGKIDNESACRRLTVEEEEENGENEEEEERERRDRKMMVTRSDTWTRGC